MGRCRNNSTTYATARRAELLDFRPDCAIDSDLRDNSQPTSDTPVVGGNPVDSQHPRAVESSTTLGMPPPSPHANRAGPRTDFCNTRYRFPRDRTRSPRSSSAGRDHAPIARRDHISDAKRRHADQLTLQATRRHPHCARCSQSELREPASSMLQRTPDCGITARCNSTAAPASDTSNSDAPAGEHRNQRKARKMTLFTDNFTGTHTHGSATSHSHAIENCDSAMCVKTPCFPGSFRFARFVPESLAPDTNSRICRRADVVGLR